MAQLLAYQHPVIQTAITMAMAAGRDLDFAVVHWTLEQAIKFDMANECRECKEAMAMSAKFQCQQSEEILHQLQVVWTHKGVVLAPGRWRRGTGTKGGSGGKKDKGKAAAAQGSITGKTEHAAEDHAYLMVAIPAYALHAAGHQTLRLLDTSTLQHYNGDLTNFVDIALCEPYSIQTASRLQYATQIGTTQFACNQNGIKTFTLKNMYHLR
jgi:hypothetical protein